jgi:hypothetical protein
MRVPRPAFRAQENLEAFMNRQTPRLPLSGVTLVSLEQAIAAPRANLVDLRLLKTARI